MSKIIIIGGGIAGYTAALELVAKDNEVTLIEKDLLGGVCLNRGCIPTKILLNFAKSQKSLNLIQKEKNQIIQLLRSNIASLISAKQITYFNSEAKILKNNLVLLKQLGLKIKYESLILAIGSRPVIPKLLSGPNVLSSDEILELNEVPSKILIVGGGYIGIEFAHIFNSLNSKVYLLEKEISILPLISKSASDVLTRKMKQKGIEIFTGTSVESCSSNIVKLCSGEIIEVDKILSCIGRVSSTIESEIEIIMEGNFIKTDGYFKTSQADIYAIGDCIGGPLLAHKAEYDAMVLSDNLLYGNKQKKDYENIPSCIFSQPAIGFIGIDQDLLKVKIGFNCIGKSYCDESSDGFLEIYLDQNKKIKGGLIVNNNAPEVLAALIPIVWGQMTCREVLKMVWTHPTSSEIIKEAARKALR